MAAVSKEAGRKESGNITSASVAAVVIFAIVALMHPLRMVNVAPQSADESNDHGIHTNQ